MPDQFRVADLDHHVKCRARLLTGPALPRAQMLTFTDAAGRASAVDLDLLPVVVLR